MCPGRDKDSQEQQTAMFASHHKLNNLVAIVDRNRLGATDFTENSLSLEPFSLRWQAFGWEVVNVNGHTIEQLIDVLLRSKQRFSTQPLVIIADTTKGKGVSFMEGSPLWHHQLPNGGEIQSALKELNQVNNQESK